MFVSTLPSRGVAIVMRRIAAFCTMVVAIVGCSNKTSGTLPTPSKTTAAAAKSTLSITISRSATGPKGELRSTKVIFGATRSVELKSFAGTSATVTPTSTTCAAFPSTSNALTLNFTVPQGQSTLTISAYDGSCSPAAGGAGAVGSGVLLSQFSGTGYVMQNSTDIAAVFNNSLPISLGVAFVSPPNKPIVASWLGLGPKSYETGGASGKLNAFAATPDFRTLLIGGGLGSIDAVGTQSGAWRSVDAGASWIPIDNGLTDTVVNGLWIDPNSPTTALAATEFGGIFRSTNLGDSWSQVNVAAPVTMIKAFGGSLYAASGTGVQISRDSGQTWSLDAATSVPVNSIGGGGGYVYAGLLDGNVWSKPPNAAWARVGTITSTSAGTFATQVHQIVNDPATPLTVYATDGGNNADGVITNLLSTSLDGGHTWSSVPFPTSDRGAQVIAMSETIPHQLYVGGTQLTTTSDGGKSFNAIGGYGDSRSIYVYPGTPEKIFGGSDQGFFASVDSGRSFTNLTSALPVSIITEMAVGNTSIITSLQDYPPIFTFDSGASWSLDFNIWGGTENDTVAINPQNPQYCYVFNGSGIWTSVDGCRHFFVQSGFQFQNGRDSIAFDPVNDTVMYVATATGIVRSSDHGQSFSPAGWPFTKPRIISIDPQSAQHIMVQDAGASNASKVSFDGGSSWISSNLNPAASSIAINPINPYIVLAAGGDYYGVEVYRSADGGRTFAQIGGPLVKPNEHLRQLRSVVRYPISPPTPLLFPSVSNIRFNPIGNAPYLALGTSRGIFVSTDYGDHFTDISGNAVSRVVNAVQWKDGFLYLGTGGQGVIKSVAPIQ